MKMDTKIVVHDIGEEPCFLWDVVGKQYIDWFESKYYTSEEWLDDIIPFNDTGEIKEQLEFDWGKRTRKTKYYPGPTGSRILEIKEK